MDFNLFISQERLNKIISNLKDEKPIEFDKEIENFKKELILNALFITNRNLTKSAKLLGISKSRIKRFIKC